MAQDDNALEALGLDPLDGAWSDWEQSGGPWRRPAEALLTPERIRRECRWAGMEPELEEVFVRAGGAIAADEQLMRVFWHGHWVLSRQDEGARRRRGWPMLPQACGEAGRMIYAMVCLSCFEQTRLHNARRGINEAITKQTLSDVALWVRQYFQENGEWGFSQLFWLTGHLTGELHQLGRLQFQMAPFPHDFHMLRSVNDGKVVLLAGEGMRFRGDGQMDGAEGIVDPPGGWTASYSEAEDLVSGYPITEQGVAKQELLSLDAAKWKAVVSKGDPILEVHIQASGGLDAGSCDESFRWAREFFPAHFPEHQFKAFTCESWLMDSQLEGWLAGESNIVRFLRRFHRYPLAGANGRQIMERVFGSPTADVERAPQDTALRRSIVAHIKAGGRWRDGGGIMLR